MYYMGMHTGVYYGEGHIRGKVLFLYLSLVLIIVGTEHTYVKQDHILSEHVESIIKIIIDHG